MVPIEALPSARPAHACHCIGCCTKCGQCRTAPWHAATCRQIAALNATRDRIIREALAVPSPSEGAE